MVRCTRSSMRSCTAKGLFAMCSWLRGRTVPVSHNPGRQYDCDLTAELHKIPARVQCTVQCAEWIDEPAPPTIP
jgi:hypothetical protein